MPENKTDEKDPLSDLLDSYVSVCEKAMDEVWKHLPIEIYCGETWEVIGGLLARQVSLTTNMASSPYIWNGHIAPILLRTMVDTYITMAWILESPSERARKYIFFGLGQEKLTIEHLKKYVDTNEGHDHLKTTIKYREDWVNSQRHLFLTEVNLGSWSNKTTREMAVESGCLDFYNFAYQPFSAATHSMWHHVAKYNLKPCINPLHKYHNVPSNVDVEPDIDYLYRSSKYLNKTIELLIEKHEIKFDVQMPMDFLVKKIDDLENMDS